MKIIIDDQIPFLEEFLSTHVNKDDLQLLATSEITPEAVRDADALFVRTRTKCNASLLEGSNVKFIGTATIGLDHIDIPWCEANGITVVNAPGSNASGVMLYIASTLQLAGFDPEIHTLGIVGKGSIGSLVAEIFRSAGTKVIVCDPPRAEKGLTDEDYLPLEDLLEQCDAVTFHVPYTKDGSHPTHHLLRGKLPQRLKIIANASRGGVVDPQLILKEAPCKRFIIDTWPFEDNAGEYDRKQIQKLLDSTYIATPHIAGYTIEGKFNASYMVNESFREYAAAQRGEKYAKKTIETFTIPPLDRLPLNYNPLDISRELKGNPDSFEEMRAAHLLKGKEEMENKKLKIE